MDGVEAVKAFWQSVWTEGNAELLSEIFHPDILENGEPVDIERFKRVVVAWHEIFPDFAASIEELIPLGEDRVLSRVTYSGTHTLPWAGLPATGRTFTVIGIDIFRVRDGQVVELWHAVDHYDMALQLGAKLVPADTDGA